MIMTSSSMQAQYAWHVIACWWSITDQITEEFQVEDSVAEAEV